MADPISKRKRNKVAIIGCAASRVEAPFHNDDFEFWGVNNLFITLRNEAPEVFDKFTRWFEFHEISKDDSGRFLRRGNPDFRGQAVDDYMKDLSALGELYQLPVYMMQKWPEVPNSVVFPFDELRQMFGREYFTNSIAWQLGLAIMEGFEEIHIYGVDMSVSSKLLGNDEYSWQRPSCEYFIGIAEGRGIKVHIPDSSDLLKSRWLYAVDEPKELAFDKKCSDMVAHIDKQMKKAEQEKARTKAEFEQIMRNLDAKINQSLGAKLAVMETQKLWQSGNDHEKAPWKDNTCGRKWL